MDFFALVSGCSSTPHHPASPCLPSDGKVVVPMAQTPHPGIGKEDWPVHHWLVVQPTPLKNRKVGWDDDYSQYMEK